MPALPTALYRIYNDADELLYVGISQLPRPRLDAHRRGAPWRSEIARTTIEEFETRKEAAFAESEAINRESPKYNKQGRRAEPKSVTMARVEAKERVKASASRLIQRRCKAAETASTNLAMAVQSGRAAGLTIPALAKLSGLPQNEVRKLLAAPPAE